MNKLACIVLGRLAVGPMAGYDLYKWMAKEAPYFGYTPQTSQIYRQLAQLEAKGLVSHEINQRDSGPDAKVYRLTREGTAAFLDWAHSDYEPTIRPLEADFQMRMLLAGVVGPEAAMTILSTELAYRRAQEADSQPYAAQTVPAHEGDLGIDPEWQNEIVRLVGERSFLLGQTNLAWLEMAHARLAAYIESKQHTDTTGQGAPA